MIRLFNFLFDKNKLVGSIGIDVWHYSEDILMFKIKKMKKKKWRVFFL